jgi:hypothetical protein
LYLEVTWRSYEEPEFIQLRTSHGLNPMCTRAKSLQTMQCPLIFYYVVEYHLLGRVIQKFELEQPIQPQIVCTSIDLHRKLFCYV